MSYNSMVLVIHDHSRLVMTVIRTFLTDTSSPLLEILTLWSHSRLRVSLLLIRHHYHLVLDFQKFALVCNLLRVQNKLSRTLFLCFLSFNSFQKNLFLSASRNSLSLLLRRGSPPSELSSYTQSLRFHHAFATLSTCLQHSFVALFATIFTFCFLPIYPGNQNLSTNRGFYLFPFPNSKHYRTLHCAFLYFIPSAKTPPCLLQLRSLVIKQFRLFYIRCQLLHDIFLEG